LVYGENLSEYGSQGVDLAQAELAWEDASGPLSGNQNAGLFKFTWKNPQPDEPIVSLDFISQMTEAAPFLVALTAE